MTESTRKIILSGRAGVGKTSLVSRYVHQRFLECYPSSAGVRIDRKELDINGHIMDMIIWDLSSKDRQQDVPQSYLLRTSGIIYVMDVSEPPSYDRITADIKFLENKLPQVPIVIVANKSDAVCPTKINDIIGSMPVKPHFVCSARDEVNVCEIFRHIGELMLP